MKSTKFLFLLLLVIILVGCQQSDSSEKLELENSLELIKVNEDPVLLKLISDNLGAASNGRVLSNAISNIDLTNAIRAEIPQRDIVRYSLLLDNDTLPDNAFQNVVLELYGDEFFPYIVQYLPDTLWVQEYGGENLTNFTGTIRAFTPEGRLLLLNKLVEGIVIPNESSPNSTNGRLQIEECSVPSLECTGYFDMWTGPVTGTTFYSYDLMCMESTYASICDDGSGSYPGGDTGLNTGGGVDYGSDDNNYDVGNPIGTLTPAIQKSIKEEELLLIQDPDLARQKLLSYLSTYGGTEGKEFVSMYNELWNIPGLDAYDKLQLNQMAYDYKQQLVTQYFVGIFTPDNVGIIIGFALNSGISSTLRNNTISIVPRYFAKSTIGVGYSSFTSFKSVHGVAGAGKEWHHIVSQRASNITKFGNSAIHNTKNLVKIEGGFSGSWHTRINSFYLTINPINPATGNRILTNNMRFGEWLAQKSFQEQMEWGLKVMEWTK